ncbi:MAG: Rpn family recombination-promoting nuclease/putative transposase [Treponema sp.]|nr:Rpn family recombination-promoting nuclease/putative transposase [Treponema sp.]MEE3434002.1 Rpn family recombination-promoting nuclease/putative transposase [Treponema sp.]
MKRKSFDELTFTDDGMFQKVMQNAELSAELVERLLGVRVKQVEYPELEKAIEPYYTSKGVRLDVYLKDEDKAIDVELQSYPQKALGKRMRYYQSMVDCDCLMKGQPYTKLRESYILFICKFDPFHDETKSGSGLPRYTFRNICAENNSVNLDDKTVKVVYNSKAYESVEDPKVCALLRFIQTNEPGEDDFSKRLCEFVAKVKENEKFRKEFTDMNLHDFDIITEAKEEKAIENARNALAMNLSAEQAAQITGLPLEQVLELQKELVAQTAN